MDEKDLFIKQKLQKDQLISKKADDVFNNFLKGEFKMEEEKTEQKVEQKTRPTKVPMMKRLLATAASFVIVFGMANVYATTKGYGNVFFMIKYLVTGEGTVVTDKSEILSDRDISISYEPIRLTENIRMQIRNLQVKDNKALLNLAVNETKLEEDSTIVPLKYKVYNSANELLCEQRSSKEKGYNGYGEELLLNNFKENDNVIVLEVYKANNNRIAKITINLQSRSITVEGEKEALQKISEIELKKYLGVVSEYNGELRYEEDKIKYAQAIYNEIKGESENKVDEINNMLESLGIEKVSDSFTQGDDYKKITKEGISYYEVINGWDECPYTVLDITDISYVDGLYDATFTYISIQEADSFDTDYSNVEKLQATVYFKVNEDDKYSKFKFVKFEKEDNSESYNSEVYIIPQKDNFAELLLNEKYSKIEDVMFSANTYFKLDKENEIGMRKILNFEEALSKDFTGKMIESFKECLPMGVIEENGEYYYADWGGYLPYAGLDQINNSLEISNMITSDVYIKVVDEDDNPLPNIKCKIVLVKENEEWKVDSFRNLSDLISYEQNSVEIIPNSDYEIDEFPEITKELDEGYVFELENVKDNYDGTYTLQGKLLMEDKSRVSVNTANGFNTSYYKETGEIVQITLSEEATYYEYSNNHGSGMASKVGWFFSNPLLSGNLDTTKVGYTFQFENGRCISMTGDEILK